jgi:hypothetical protein
MPYLHWETSRKREQFASEIDVIVTIEAREKAKNEAKTRLNRQKRRRSLPDVQQNHQDSSCHHELPSTAIRSFEQAVEAKMKKQNEQRKFQSKHKLGRYLLAAAHLCEAIKTYRDKKLLRKYLPLDPPLHPRRTLDQSFYWTLNSTEKRDKDQVVYRGTTATRNDFHQRDENDSWPDHPERFNGTCETCRASIQKVSRVIMVDQLWMWVLDEKTIITCFPSMHFSTSFSLVSGSLLL